jgi:hypothetical protein
MNLLRYGPGPRQHLAWRDTDTWLPQARAWTTVLVSPAWWRLPGEDSDAHRSGVELA